MATKSPSPNAGLIEEHEIRSALRTAVAERWRCGSALFEEFRIERGSSRIDMATIDSELSGYEIKSDRDSFARFSNQIHAYNRVFDRITLVCGPTHAERAQAIVPSWWGIAVASRTDDGAILIEVRRTAERNPKQSAFSLASLLWKDEAISALSALQDKTPPLRRATVHDLWDLISQSAPLESIRPVVTKMLLRRRDYKDIAVNTM